MTTRPLALIEGDLTIPLPRPFDGLPPPFGARRNRMHDAVQRAVRQTPKTMRPSRFPPGVKHVLFYKVPPQRAVTQDFDAWMAEAKRYLEMGKVRPRSSRSDHVLAATIFAGCTIALTWLLVTCSMKDAEKAKGGAVAPTVLSAASVGGDRPKPVVKPVAADAQTTVAVEDSPAQIVSVEPSDTPVKPANAEAPPVASLSQVASASPEEAALPGATQVPSLSPVESKQIAQTKQASATERPQDTQVVRSLAAESVQVAQSASPSFAAPTYSTPALPKQSVRPAVRGEVTVAQAAKTTKRVKVASLSEAHVNERVALNRAVRPATSPEASMQPEWSASAARSHSERSTDDMPWLSWADRQHRSAPAMRAATPVDNSWNDRMTQRRITDDPASFHTDRATQ
ncbi:hypothetical protein P3T43_000767 [Paraburkholderia sp. GAS41]|uniref:hypothetical protein n=1 Tax=Paraburkholderia sp. GAS41 TaxID=3035134 RepID=UPI003D1A0F89